MAHCHMVLLMLVMGSPIFCDTLEFKVGILSDTARVFTGRDAALALAIDEFMDTDTRYFNIT